MKRRISDTFAIASWYHYLQIAIREGLPIAKKYEAWGAPDEILNTKFATWWRARGEKLFNTPSTNEVVVCKETEDTVTLVIPRGLPANEAIAKVRAAISGKVGKQFQRDADEFAYSSRVHYAKLRQYERLLDLRLETNQSGETINELGNLLKEKYEKIRTKSLARASTLKRNGSKVWRKVTWIDPVNFRRVYAEEVLEKAPRRNLPKVSDFGEKVIRQWLNSGFITLLNVAEGSFPGPQSTGKQVAGIVRARLQKLGREDLLTGKRSKGGGSTRAQRTQVQERWTKAEQRARAKKALREGTGIKGSRLDHGNTTQILSREQQVTVDLAKIKARKRGIKI